MSLFDVLRYPISYPPQAEEFAALPESIYNKWIKNSSWSIVDTESSSDMIWVTQWMKRNLNSPSYSEEIISDLKILRKIISEWITPDVSETEE